MADANKRPSFPKVTTPRVTFRYPKLHEPDYGNDNFPKPNGEYSVQAIMQLGDPATQAFIEQMTPLHDAAVAEAEAEFAKLPKASRVKLKEVSVNPLYTVVYDKETEEETGEIFFKFTMVASGEYKKGPKAGQTWNRKPAIFDARGMKITQVPEVGGGTIGKVSFEARPYFIKGTGAAGLKLALEAAQIIDLKQWGEKDASGYGFGEEEDGYTHAGGFQDETGSDGAGDLDDY